MDPSILDRALDFFAPSLNPGAVVNFTGGEPLLVFSMIKRAVTRLNGSDVDFALATNGSLITREIAGFLDSHQFAILLSWDGPLQARQRGEFLQVANAVRLLLSHQSIRLETNTVITPSSVHFLAPTLRWIHAAGITAMHVTPDRTANWTYPALEELERQLMLISCRKDGRSQHEHLPLPLASLPIQGQTGVPVCTAGRDRLALSPYGEVWGCHRFVDFFCDGRPHMQRSQYAFGELERFITGYPDTYNRLLPSYQRLRPSYYSNERGLCIDCPDLSLCGVCPVPFGPGVVGAIPASACRIQAVLRRFTRPPCD